MPDSDERIDRVAHRPGRARRAVGVLLGCGTSFLGLLYFAGPGTLLGPFLLRPRTRDRARAALGAGARRLVGPERARRVVFLGDRFPPRGARADEDLRALRYLAARTYAGLLCTVVLGLPAVGAVLAVVLAAVLRAVDAERRRIERDLHDGVQQRLVAPAMLLGRARRNRTPEQAGALLEQAHQESRDVLTELRDVAWRVCPTALDSLGLQEALGGVAQRCSIPLRMEFALPPTLPRPVETAAYFVVSEAVTNAAKHSGAGCVQVRLTGERSLLTVRIEDDGRGGADPAGSGLSGLRDRVAALDGRLRVDSPPGGPTTIIAELPCV
ncbi:sensor histidine kinase [Streptomyces sp. NPDC052164]|uniref:sensor histidine kinase n=1 Tax=Streptomyces sp. NPDC052164 TaxID=3155529 RepID=UPI00344571CC